ncbi:MAG: UbiH/UbiF/VisC/COQ6 family ubiquinone biosynthesis hydroxylase [Rhodospirillales bacterium]
MPRATTASSSDTRSTGREPVDLEADVLIVGGGVAGSLMAAALADRGLTAVLVDRGDPEKVRLAEADGRAYAIAVACKRVIEALGVWDAMAPHATPILDIHVTDGRAPFYLHYDHQDVGEGPMGYLIASTDMIRHAQAAIETRDGVTFIAPMTVEAVERDAAGAQARLGDGRRVAARLVIAADGRPSPTREAAGIRTYGWSYGQTAIVCTVAHEKSHGFCAHEHFLPSGPFAILPMDGSGGGFKSSLVWTETSELAPIMLGLNERDFLVELATRFGDFLGDIQVEGPRFSYPLGLQVAEAAVQSRLCLIADAYHGMHPIAGQGLNMGIRDIAVLADVLDEARSLGRDIGGLDVLRGYQRWRHPDNLMMLAATDGLNRLFSNRIKPLRLARDLGLAAVDRLPELKRFFMRDAMGLTGKLPTLMQG